MIVSLRNDIAPAKEQVCRSSFIAVQKCTLAASHAVPWLSMRRMLY